MESIPPVPPYEQRLKDFILEIREDFYLWRTNPANEWVILTVVSGMGACLSVWVIRRLWRSRRKLPTEPKGGVESNRQRIRTPLHELETMAQTHLGVRSVGLTYARWIAGLSAVIPLDDLLDRAIELHQQARFDPEHADEDLLAQLEDCVERIRKIIESSDR